MLALLVPRVPPGATATAGTAGEAAPAPAPATFQLTNATAASPESAAPAAGAPATTTETPNAAPAAAAQTYRLIANPTALSPHVGKKLALTGTLDESAPPATASSTGSEPKMLALKVESGKVIAESCNQQ